MCCPMVRVFAAALAFMLGLFSFSVWQKFTATTTEEMVVVPVNVVEQVEQQAIAQPKVITSRCGERIEPELVAADQPDAPAQVVNISLTRHPSEADLYDAQFYVYNSSNKVIVECAYRLVDENENELGYIDGYTGDLKPGDTVLAPDGYIQPTSSNQIFVTYVKFADGTEWFYQPNE